MFELNSRCWNFGLEVWVRNRLVWLILGRVYVLAVWIFLAGNFEMMSWGCCFDSGVESVVLIKCSLWPSVFFLGRVFGLVRGLLTTSIFIILIWFWNDISEPRVKCLLGLVRVWVNVDFVTSYLVCWQVWEFGTSLKLWNWLVIGFNDLVTDLYGRTETGRGGGDEAGFEDSKKKSYRS